MVLQSFRIRDGSGSVSCVRSTNSVPQSYHIDAYPLPCRVQFGVDVTIQVDVAFRLRCALRIPVGFFDNNVVVDVPATYDIVVDVFQSPVVCHLVYRRLIELIAKFDPVLKDHISRSAPTVEGAKRKHTYLSHTIQDELITKVAEKVKFEIVSKIKKAKYYSILLDCTPDVSHQVVIRFVNTEVAIIEIEERFICFEIVDDTTGQGLFDKIKQLLNFEGLSILDCRGQGYDNDANMKGIYNGVQAHILRQNPKAFFTPCGSHNLNLVFGEIAKSSVLQFHFSELYKKYITFFLVDTAIISFQKRFTTYEEHANIFGFVYILNKLKDMKQEELHKNCKDLHLKLEDDIDGIDLYEELMMLRNILPQNYSILEALQFIFDNNLSEIYPNSIIVLQIILTSPVTTATAERSFSKLKIIKNYLRSTISQERFTSLSILSIEHDIAKSMDYNDVVLELAAKRARGLNDASDTAFCFPCRCFKGNEINSSYSESTFSSNGFKAWYRAIDAFKKHQSSKCHLNSAKALTDFINLKSIDCVLDKNRLEEISRKEKDRSKNREFMNRIIDIIICLGKSGRPFRGHDEKSDSCNQGLYKELVILLIKYDVVLQDHLQEAPKYALYTSNRIQNGLITSIKNVILRNIKNNIQNSFISIMADETTDVGHFEQLSVVFRSQAIFDCLHDVLILMGKDWHSVLSVCFDGASTMAEKISKDVGIKLLTLKSCSITRWACRAEAVKSVLNNYEVLLLAIEEICESSSVQKCSPNMDLVLAVNSVQSLVQNLMAMRNSDEEFRNIYQRQNIKFSIFFKTKKNELKITVYNQLLDELISGINSRFNQEIVQLVQAVASMIRLDTTPVMISILSNFANVPVEKLQSEIKLLKYLPATDESASEESNDEDISNKNDKTTNNDVLNEDEESEKETPSKRKVMGSLSQKTKSLKKIKIPASYYSKTKKNNKPQTASSVLMKYILDNETNDEPKATSYAHPIDTFFQGLAATVKTFSPEYQHMAKNKLFGIVSDLEWAQLQNKSANPQIPLSVNPSTSYFCSNTQVAPSQNTMQYIQTPTPSPISRPSSSTSTTTQHFYENFDPTNVQNMY
ncbi:hypothetical protein QTP88_000747 [Uroleucon formosanum]